MYKNKEEKKLVNLPPTPLFENAHNAAAHIFNHRNFILVWQSHYGLN